MSPQTRTTLRTPAPTPAPGTGPGAETGTGPGAGAASETVPETRAAYGTGRRPAPGVAYASYDGLLERVRYEGAYPTRERAEEAVRTVLAALGRQLVGDERVDLAARLPVEAALVLTAQIPAVTPLTGWEFVKDLAQRTGGSLATTRWDVGAVLAPVAHLAGAELIERVIRQLPSGYALLFGKAELHQPR